MIPIIIFLLSIGLQVAAAVFALFLVRATGRKLAWVLLSLAMVLMAGRRLVSFVSLLIAGKEVPFNITELIALIISCLMLAGVLRIEKYFRSIRANEDALRKSEATNRALLNAIPDLMFRIKRDGTFLDFKKAKDFDPYVPPSEFLSKKIYEVLPIEVARQAMHYLEQALQTGDTQIFEYQLSINSNMRNYEARIVVSGENEVLAIVRDITERKRAEGEIINYQKKIEALINSSSDIIFLKDRDFRYLVANKAHEKLFNIKITDIIGKTDFDFMPKEVATGCRKTDEEALKSDDPIENEEFVGDRWFHVVKQRIVDATGNIVWIAAVIRDITEHKRLEAQLYQAQKMEAVGTLAGGIAHDFNNILTAIMGHGSLLRMNMSNDNPLMPYVEQILTSSERAANLTRSLLAFSRKQIISPKPVNLNEIIKRIGKLLSRLISEDIELKTILAAKDLTVMADSGQIEQVLMNLATNARDAMHEGGFLTVETELVELDKEYIKIHGYGEIAEYALISVTDTGVGMDEKTRERIFEPFFTTKEFGRGTGLGLAMVYGIIKQHNGYINCYSEPGKGTTFKIYLPLIETELAESQPTTSPSPAGGTETALIAEDDAAVRKLIRDVLEGAGYKVIEAEDGEDAIIKFTENKDKIQFLILDVIMPKKNGKEAYEEIRKMRPDVKALFMSGYTADIIHKKGILEDGISFISKPVSPDSLLRKVREALDK